MSLIAESPLKFAGLSKLCENSERDDQIRYKNNTVVQGVYNFNFFAKLNANGWTFRRLWVSRYCNQTNYTTLCLVFFGGRFKYYFVTLRGPEDLLPYSTFR